MGCGGSAAKRQRPDPIVTYEEGSGPWSDSEDSMDGDHSFSAHSRSATGPQLDRQQRIELYRNAMLTSPRVKDPSSPSHVALKDDVFLVAALAIEGSPCPGVVLTESGLVVALNKRACEVFEIAEDSFPATATFADLLRIPPTLFGDQPQLAALAGAAGGVAATGVTFGTGQEFPVLVHGVELPFGEGGGWTLHIEASAEVAAVAALASSQNGISPIPSPAPSPRVESTRRQSNTSVPRVNRGRQLSRQRRVMSQTTPPMDNIIPGARRASPLAFSAGREDGSVASASTAGSHNERHRIVKGWAFGDVCLVVDSSGIIIGSTPGARRLFAREEDKMKGADVDALINTLDDDRSLRNLILDGEASLYRGEEDRVFTLWKPCVDCARVEQVWVSSIVEGVWDAEEDTSTVWYTVRLLPLETTNSKEQHAKGLLQSLRGGVLSEEVTCVFEATSHPTLVCSETGDIMYANDAAVRVVGYSRDDLQHESVTILVPYPWKKWHTERIRILTIAGTYTSLRGTRGLPLATKSGRIVPAGIEIRQMEMPKGPRMWVCRINEITGDVAALSTSNNIKMRKLPEMMETAKADARNKIADDLHSAHSGSFGRSRRRESGGARSLRSLHRLDLIRNSAASLGSKRSLCSPSPRRRSSRGSVSHGSLCSSNLGSSQNSSSTSSPLPSPHPTAPPSSGVGSNLPPVDLQDRCGTVPQPLSPQYSPQ
eukprot:Hpha_TRINITY_DN10114_c0_g1::TRINITY_DN10114_c0_g1_i1::g.131538::m.131538